MTSDPAPAASGAEGAGAAASGSPSAMASPANTAPATPPPATPPATPTKSESIDACCSALSAIKSSGKEATTKAKAAAAAAVCGPIAKRVKAGETSRASALTQIRSAMVGVTVPPECK